MKKKIRREKNKKKKEEKRKGEARRQVKYVFFADMIFQNYCTTEINYFARIS